MDKPWYHRPEWIAAIVTIFSLAGGSIWSTSQSSAQTRQNTLDISQLKHDTATVPADIAGIKQAQIDQTEILRTIDRRMDTFLTTRPSSQTGDQLRADTHE